MRNVERDLAGGPKPYSSFQVSVPVVSLLHCHESKSAALMQSCCIESSHGHERSLKHTSCGC